MRPRTRSPLVAVAITLAALAAGCGEDSTFTLGRDLDPCIGNVPTACTLSGGCVLDEGHYITGTFPSARRFVVRTGGGEALRIGILLFDQRSPGTELLVNVSEPSCGDRFTWDSGGRDLFRLADSGGVVVIPVETRLPGDHLVELFSDAYCGYTLAINP